VRLPPDDLGGGGVHVDFHHLAGLGDDAELIQPAVIPAAEGDADDLAAERRAHLRQDVGQRLGLATLDGEAGTVVVMAVMPAEIIIVIAAPGDGVPSQQQAGCTEAKAEHGASGSGAHCRIMNLAS
jgi:hypothetical protein